METTQSLIEMFKKFGGDLGLPKIDVEKAIEMHRKNIEALAESAEAASEGARFIAGKQREMVESVFREAAAMVQNYKPGGEKDLFASQAEFAKKAFDFTMQNTREITELAVKSTTDAGKILQDRMKANLEDIRESAGRSKSDAGKKE